MRLAFNVNSRFLNQYSAGASDSSHLILFSFVTGVGMNFSPLNSTLTLRLSVKTEFEGFLCIFY